MKILVAHASSYDYRTELYESLKQSVLAQKHTIIFPYDEDNGEIDTNSHVSNADLLIAEVSHPSTGTGIEVGLAQAAGVRTIFLYKIGATPSSALKFIKGELIQYTDISDLSSKVEEYLVKS